MFCECYAQLLTTKPPRPPFLGAHFLRGAVGANHLLERDDRLSKVATLEHVQERLSVVEALVDVLERRVDLTRGDLGGNDVVEVSERVLQDDKSASRTVGVSPLND